MTIVKDKPRDDSNQADALEFSQGQDLDEDAEFNFFDIEHGNGNKRSAGTYQDGDVEIDFVSAVYHEPEPDYSKLQGILPSFERDLERLEQERDNLKDRYTHAWNQGDLVSYLALESKWHELNGFIKGLNVLKKVLRHWEEYEWGEMDISDYYRDETVVEPMHRAAAQKKFDTIISRAIQILSQNQPHGKDLS